MGGRTELVDRLDPALLLPNSGAVVWADVAEPTDADGVVLREVFALHELPVEAALQRLVASLPAGGTAVVLTSGGPIAWAAASLLADSTAARTDLWLRLNPVSVNTGVSTIVCGGRGTTLVSFNAHDHLLSARSPHLLTYR